MALKRSSLWWLPVLIVSVVLNIFLIAKTTSTGVSVIGVIDGDTLVLEGKSKVRLRYVDAPEINLCGGQEAKAYLEKLVVGRKVRLEDLIPDQYGRGMALVYVGDTLINKAMVASGWVRYHHDNSPVTDEVKQVSEAARSEKRGIYGMCQSLEPDKPNCIIKGNLDKNSNAKTYYLPGCAQYSFTVVEKDIGEAWFCTEAEARQAGYTKAKTCK